jgi:hypothetical protein
MSNLDALLRGLDAGESLEKEASILDRVKAQIGDTTETAEPDDMQTKLAYHIADLIAADQEPELPSAIAKILAERDSE